VACFGTWDRPEQYDVALANMSETSRSRVSISNAWRAISYCS